LNTIRMGRARFLGDGSNTLGLTYVTDVADAVLLAGTHEGAIGEAFNVSTEEHVSQQRYFDGLADMVGAPRVKQSLPIRRAYQIAAAMEVTYRLLGIRKRPLITRQAVSLMALPHRCLNRKIRHRLGWHPLVSFQLALERIHAWWFGLAGEVGAAIAHPQGSRAA
jgi:nucleoside-diphosphate-sugar epimerase